MSVQCVVVFSKVNRTIRSTRRGVENKIGIIPVILQIHKYLRLGYCGDFWSSYIKIKTEMEKE